VKAGFHLDEVITPPEALALIARQHQRTSGREGAAWLALNRHGAAIAIVHGGEPLFSREFSWHYRQAATARQELLQRYTLVAHLAPELRHGLDIVRQQHGLTVDVVITCGDLPDLRSLTMPLIEELDMEVETLDSLEGLEISDVVAAAIGDKAPAVRLALAAGTGRRGAHRVPLARMAAAAAVIVLLVGIAWGVMRVVARGDDPSSAAVSSSPAAAAASGGQREPVSPAPTRSPSAASDLPATERARQAGDQSAPAATSGREAPATASASDAGSPSLPARPQPRTEQPPEPASADTALRARPEAVPGTGSAGVPPEKRVQPAVPERPRPSAATAQRARVPLRDPLPVVNSILVAPDRRLAVVDGAIVREGEAVGPRVLIRIEHDAVLLREPSGHQVRVTLRRRVGTPAGT
jgi:hypothetical protein